MLYECVRVHPVAPFQENKAYHTGMHFSHRCHVVKQYPGSLDTYSCLTYASKEVRFFLQTSNNKWNSLKCGVYSRTVFMVSVLLAAVLTGWQRLIEEPR